MAKGLYRFGTVSKATLCLFVLITVGCISWAQTFNGNANDLGNSCTQITSNNMWEVGSVFYPDTLDLTQPFNFLLDLNFGSADANGADGMVFVLQNNNATQLGAAGGSLGWFGIPNSLGIEFDTYPNPPESDPVDDHIAILRDGNINHTFSQNLAGPVSADPNGANIEDGQDHQVQIKWNPANFRLQVYFDCNLRLSYTIDMVNTIFGGDTEVFWGVTGASGGAFNPHRACVLNPLQGSIDSLEICQGDTSLLLAPGSQDGIYSWEPAINTSANSGQSIQVWPGQITNYQVSYLDPCGIPTVDTFVVEVSDLPDLELGNDTSFCSGVSFLLNPGLTSGNISWSDGSITDTLRVDTTGLYTVEVLEASGCVFKDSIIVSFIDPPAVATNRDTTICGKDSIYLLSVLDVVPLTEYVWSTGDTATEIIAEESGVYVVEAINSCSTATDSVEVIFYKYEEGFFIPNVLTPNGDGFNDRFLVENFRPEDFYLRIFDRWGQPAFRTEDRTESWDGNFGENPAQEGVYFYLVQTRDCLGNLVEKKGHLTLIK